MTIPNRAQMLTLQHCKYTLLSVFFFFVVLFIASFFAPPGPLSPWITLPIIGALLVLICVAVTVDQRTLTKSVGDGLTLHNFERITQSKLHPKLIYIYKNTYSTGLSTPTEGDVYERTIDGRLVILAQHLARSGTVTLPYTSCAVQIYPQLPTIHVQPKFFTPKSRFTPLNIPEFDAQRILSCDDFESGHELIDPLADWFVTKRKSILRKIMRAYGDDEIWTISGHWVLMAQQGQARTEMWLQMAEFTTAFADALEQHVSSLDDCSKYTQAESK